MFDSVKFISLVQSKPPLYNADLKEYSNRDLRMKCWEEIAQEMYKDSDSFSRKELYEVCKRLQTKWRSIRDHFMKEWKQRKLYNSDDSVRKKYIHYDLLLFLTDESRNTSNSIVIENEYSSDDGDTKMLTENLTLASYVPRRSSRSTDVVRQICVSPPDEYVLGPGLWTGDQVHTVSSFSEPSTSATTMTIRSKKRQREEEASESLLQITDIVSRDADLRKEEDRSGNKAFLMSLLPLMEKLSDDANLSVRIKLLQVIRKTSASVNRTRVSAQYNECLQLSCPTNADPPTCYYSEESHLSNNSDSPL